MILLHFAQFYYALNFPVDQGKIIPCFVWDFTKSCHCFRMSVCDSNAAVGIWDSDTAPLCQPGAVTGMWQRLDSYTVAHKHLYIKIKNILF